MSARRGVWIFLVVLALFGAALMVAALSLRRIARPSTGPTVLLFDVPAQLEEAEPPALPLSFSFVRTDAMTLPELLATLRRAASDSRVKAVRMRVDDLDWGWAKIAEVREALQRVRAAGKPVVASLSGGGDAAYFLASAATTVSTPANAMLQVDGLAATALFMRGGLDKLGVRAHYAQAGRYKSAPEQYTRGDLSPPAREALEALLDDHYRLLVDSLASARGVAPAAMEALLDNGPYDGPEALAAGLVDTLLYEAEADSLALTLGGVRSMVSLRDYAERAWSSSGGPRIALVAASGTLLPGRSRYRPTEGVTLGAETLIEALDDARQRSGIRAVVLRIDSPGGVFQAADDVWRAVRRCAEVKPVIVSMSDVAASGGYYIAAPASWIVADPLTVTGSIGVYAGKFNIIGLYNKLGLTVETIQRGRHAGMLSPFRDFTDEEAARFAAHVDRDYRTFLDRVAEGRNMETSGVDSVAQGRVWSGLAARAIGLVDTLGGLDTAFGIALSEAGYPEDGPFTVEVLPEVHRSFLERLVSGWMEAPEDDAWGAIPADVRRAFAEVGRLPAGAALALMPYRLEIH